jgi:hypothetical protein
LIDEPEAFLHPPQAFRLGHELAKLIPMQRRQAIIATHSADFVRGVLASGSEKLTICRIERMNNVNNAFILNASDIRQLWSMPSLRSSEAIDGIFHEGVVVCEADADARFYESVLGMVSQRFSRPIELYFTQGNGKGALAPLAKAYRSLNIRTAVIVDLDLLKNPNEFANVYTALGGDFAGVSKLSGSVTHQLADTGSVLALADAVDEFRRLVTRIETENCLSTEVRRKALEVLENAADWSEAKKYGVDKLSGGARRDAQHLLEECQRLGLFLVPCGELEGWWRNGPASKCDWIVSALTKLRVESNEFAEAEEFIRDLCSFFGYK